MTQKYRFGWAVLVSGFDILKPKDGFTLRFGVFEFDPATGELSKQGARVKLEGQTQAVLATLLARPGDLIPREELHKELWSGDTLAEFEHSLDAAVGRLRVALSDSEDTPRYIETVPGQGYRFIAPVAGTPARPPSGGVLARWSWLMVVGAFVLLGIGVWSWGIERRISASLAASQTIHAVAVLPLENLTGDPSQEDFADQLTDALITDLAQISSLRVVPGASVMRFKQTRQPAVAIARELGVEGIVAGSVVRTGDRIRISSQLILAASGQQIWSRSYERDRSDIGAFEGEVAQAIAGEVRASIASEKRSP